MLTKNDVKGIVTCIIAMIMIATAMYFVTMFVRSSWIEMYGDVSKRTVEVVKTYAPVVIKRIFTEIVESLRV